MTLVRSSEPGTASPGPRRRPRCQTAAQHTRHGSDRHTTLWRSCISPIIIGCKWGNNLSGAHPQQLRNIQSTFEDSSIVCIHSTRPFSQVMKFPQDRQLTSPYNLTVTRFASLEQIRVETNKFQEIEKSFTLKVDGVSRYCRILDDPSTSLVMRGTCICIMELRRSFVRLAPASCFIPDSGPVWRELRDYHSRRISSVQE
jgi:hypothetical protein